MKWTMNKSPKSANARDLLVAKTVVDDLLSQISGGAAAALQACHPR